MSRAPSFYCLQPLTSYLTLFIWTFYLDHSSNKIYIYGNADDTKFKKEIMFSKSSIKSEKMVRFMKTNRNFTAIIEREGDGYVSLCPELDIASQGETVEEASRNLTEALELFFEHASESEIKERLHNEVFITRLEVAIG
jgi:predicted RNase H-like HicB family nuclease